MKKIKLLLTFVLVIFTACLLVLPSFLIKQFGEMNFDQILFVLVSKGDGANTDIVFEFIRYATPSVLVCTFFSLLVLFLSRYRFKIHIHVANKLYTLNLSFRRTMKKTIFAVFLILITIGYSFDSQLNVSGYVMDRINPGTLFETYYVQPNNVDIVFPQEKQNLIYIVLESMNNNFNEVNVDDNFVNLIPNLEQLSFDNVSVSNNELLGGHVQTRGLTWTVGSLVGQTSGIPLQVPIDANSYGTEGSFLPGITSLGDILEDNGYSNYFLMGSDGNFGGRQTYFETHGNYTIYDTKSLKEIGYLPEDYHVFWGMEDSKMFEFARTQLLEISAKNEPFNFSMLTVDSHFMDGYTDGSCPASYSVAYANAIECSDHLISEFIKWIQAQDFYENTTVILVADHNTMNGSFLNRSASNDYTLYNAFINTNAEVDVSRTVNRDFTVMDYFPTTLAALGVEIEGNKLGLGTNLFSEEQTLLEILGLDALTEELAKKSLYYEKNFFR